MPTIPAFAGKTPPGRLIAGKSQCAIAIRQGEGFLAAGDNARCPMLNLGHLTCNFPGSGKISFGPGSRPFP